MHPLGNRGNEDSQEQPLRVLFVIGALDGGGAEKVLVELLQELDRTRVQPSLFIIWRRGVYLDKVPPDVTVTWGVDGDDFVRRHAPGALSRLLAATSKCDVVVGAVELLPSYFAWLGAALCGKPLLGWIHQDLDAYIRDHPRWDRAVASLLYPRFDSLVVLTEPAVDSLLRFARVQRNRVHVIPNYVSARAVLDLADEPLPSWSEPITTKKFVIGVGRLVNRDKGWDVLLRAHALVRSQGIDHNFVIVGEGLDRKNLEDLAKMLGVRDSFFLPGFQKNPFPLLKSAVALVAGARLEGFGLALVEAMALGVPVVASSSTSGPVAILENGKHGVLVKADDVEGFAAGIAELLTNASVREEYSRRATLRARIYDTKTANQWEDLVFDAAKKV